MQEQNEFIPQIFPKTKQTLHNRYHKNNDLKFPGKCNQTQSV